MGIQGASLEFTHLAPWTILCPAVDDTNSDPHYTGMGMDHQYVIYDWLF